MSGILYAKPLLSSVSLNGSASSVPSAVDLRFIYRAESLIFRASKNGGTASIKIQYAISRNGSSIDGSYVGNRSIVTASAEDFPESAKAWNAAALPNFLAPYVYFRFSGATGNPATGVTISADLVVRDSILG
jgi:hypothetical protein